MGDANPNKQDVCGQTPTSSASENGHEGVVKFLGLRKVAVASMV